ncbi:hypothetical protein EV424DRAFT_1644414 [Suillus variegatus]|nr:hypothetical protein EV424DRAFT_1644414 [Suillus variegatus]
MTTVWNVNSYRIFSYFTVTASVGVYMIGVMLTFGQEVELFWKGRRSLMTILYLSIRYIGIGYVILKMLSRIMYIILESTNEVVAVMLGVILIARLNAMYQRSNKMLAFLVVIFLAIRIANTVVSAISIMHISVEEVVLSGTYGCKIDYAGNTILLYAITWILDIGLELLLLGLTLRIAVKRLRELRQYSKRGIFGDCCTVLVKTHLCYFASFVAVSCFYVGFSSPTLSGNLSSVETQIYLGIAQIFQFAQMFVLGPRLILSVRGHHAEDLAGPEPDTTITLTSISFLKRAHLSTSGSVEILDLFYRFVERHTDDDGGDMTNLGRGCTVAASVGVIYDWVLTFGQEVELFWKGRRSLMTILYLSIRYVGIGYVILKMLSRIMYITLESTNEVVDVMLGVILIARLNAMYQQSRKMLLFLVVIFLAIRIANAVMAAMSMIHISVEEVVLSGTYGCKIDYVENTVLLYTITWVLAIGLELLLLGLTLWIAVKHLRELRQYSTRGVIGDCFTVLVKTHLCYFASFVAVSCFYVGFYSPTLSGNLSSVETEFYLGVAQIFHFAQLFVLGPRLILSVRGHHAEDLVGSESDTMTTIIFSKRVPLSTSGSREIL